MASPLAGINPFSWFDYRKTVYPDLFEVEEAMLCQRYKAHGLVVERYEPPQPWTAWNPLADPELERRLKYFYKRLQANLLCRRSIWGFSKPALKARVLDAYKAVNSALSSGNLELAEPYLTEQMMQRLTGEVARRGRKVHVMWQLADPQPEEQDIQLVCGGVAYNPVKSGRLHFVQWTVRIASRQRVAVYDAKGGRLIAGDPDKVLDVVDYWVFERPILRALLLPRPGPMDAKWRIMARL